MNEPQPKKSLKDIINEQIAFLDLGTVDNIVSDIKRGINDLIGLVIKKPTQLPQQQVNKSPPAAPAPAPAPAAIVTPSQNTSASVPVPEQKMTVHTFVDPETAPAEEPAPAPAPAPAEPVQISLPEPLPAEPVITVTPPAPVSVIEPEVKEEAPAVAVTPPQPPPMPEQHIMPPPLSESYEQPKQLLDNKMVKSLHHSLGEETFRELYDELWVKADSIYDLLNKALSERNMKTINERGHEMKGMCANFGLSGISSVCRDIEESGMREDYATAAMFIPHLPELLKDSRQHIQDFLDGKLVINNLDDQEDDDKSGYMI